MSQYTFADLWATAGTAAAREFDADGIPIWGHHPEHGYHHASGSAIALAEEAWTYRRADESHFLLAEFDAWLSALPPCPMKEELLRRRALAVETVIAPGEYGRNVLLRHLEFMDGRWREHLREHALLPLARSGRKHANAQSERAKNPRTPPEIDEAINAALTREGTAKEQWGYLRARLEEEGFVVRDTITEGGGVAYEIHTPTAGDGAARDPFPFSLKRFQNRRASKKKSRQPG